MARADRLRDWADGRDAKARAAAQRAESAVAGIEPGQPILLGHHSQRRHERDVQRAHAAMGRLAEHTEKARGMRQRAQNIQAAADRAVYADDPDVAERLRARLAANEKRRDGMKECNAAFRRAHRDRLAAMSSIQRDMAMPHPRFELSNLGSLIRRDRARLAYLQGGWS
jgi:hypothetical protein